MIKARKQLRLSLKNLIAWEQSHPMTILIFFLTLEEEKKLLTDGEKAFQEFDKNINEAIKQIDNLQKGKIVKDKQVVSLMRYYELIKELDNVRSK